MKQTSLKNLNLPDKPGVYFFKRGTDILYIGKATSLKDRVRSYFSADLDLARGPAIVQMVELADNLSFIETDSVLEALILEAEQIKKHRPKYNVQEKDDKSFNFVVITKEDYPRVLLVRGKELRDNENLAAQVKYQFGPFPQGGELKEALKIVRKIFPYRDKCLPNVGKPCFNAQIGLCPEVCAGLVSKTVYQQTINNIHLLFSGKKTTVLKNLEQEMKALAQQQKFEEAGVVKKKLFALTHIQDVALLKYHYAGEVLNQFRIEAYDIAHLAGKDTVGVMTVVVDGEADKSSYRRFTIKGAGKEVANDIANLKEVLTRRFSHQEWPWPDLIVLDGSKAQLNAGRSILSALALNIPLVSVVKDDHHRPKEILGRSQLVQSREREILLANSEAHRFAIHFHRQIRGRVV